MSSNNWFVVELICAVLTFTFGLLGNHPKFRRKKWPMPLMWLCCTLVWVCALLAAFSP